MGTPGTARRVAHAVTSEAHHLGEGPVWDGARDRLLWVDIDDGAVLEGRLRDDRVEVVRRTSYADELGTVGAVAVAADGSLLAAGRERLLAVRPDGSRADGARVVRAGERRRLNDGKPDPAGRFVVGTLSLGEPDGHDRLVRVEPDGSLTVLDDDLTLANGIAWSPDGRRMYSADTLRGVVHVRDYDAASGAVGSRREHLRLDDGFPDGIAMDAEDHLWVAVWGAGLVRRFSPDGCTVEEVVTGAPNSTSVAFAGDDLRTLVVTSATEKLTDEQRARHPLSGRLFAVRVDVPGTPVAPWDGNAGDPAR